VLILAGEFEVDPDNREAFLASRTDVMRTSRSEPGCLEYAMSADPVDPARVLLFERWESQEHLDAHLAGLRARGSQGDQIAPRRMVAVIYDVAGERPLG
jgi:quinol monooxygenase YgiN